MLPRLVLAAFLLGHAAVHAGFLSPRPAATVGGPVGRDRIARHHLASRPGTERRLTAQRHQGAKA